MCAIRALSVRCKCLSELLITCERTEDAIPRVVHLSNLRHLSIHAGCTEELGLDAGEVAVFAQQLLPPPLQGHGLCSLRLDLYDGNDHRREETYNNPPEELVCITASSISPILFITYILQTYNFL